MTLHVDDRSVRCTPYRQPEALLSVRSGPAEFAACRCRCGRRRRCWRRRVGWRERPYLVLIRSALGSRRSAVLKERGEERRYPDGAWRASTESASAAVV